MSDPEKFLTMLQSEKASVRYEACEELRVSENLPKSALLALQTATNDNDPLVADAASRALHLHSESAIAGQPSLSEISIDSERVDQAENDDVLKEYYYKQAVAKQQYKKRKIYNRKETITTRPSGLMFPIIWTILLSYIFFSLAYPALEDGNWIIVMIISIVIFFTGRYWYGLIKNTMRINRDSAFAIATILNKETGTSYHYDEYGGGGTTTTYYLYLEFNPRQAEHHTGHITISAQLNKGFWERLDIGQKINVHYALEDPLILSIEGE